MDLVPNWLDDLFFLENLSSLRVCKMRIFNPEFAHSDPCRVLLSHLSINRQLSFSCHPEMDQRLPLEALACPSVS